MTRITQLLSLCCLMAASQAAVVDFEIRSRAEVAGGQAFGTAGPYERISGRVRFALDPKHVANRRIVDVARASLSEQGLVEFSADVYILRPTDLTRGNGTVLFEVLNRGKKGMLGMFNHGRASNDPVTAEHVGDGLLLREGYTLLWIGWQHDVPESDGLMRLYPPVARGVSGLVRSEFAATPGTTHIPLGDTGHVPYSVADPRSLAVSVRHQLNGPRTPLPASEWKLDGGRIVLSQPSATPAIYEVVYRSADAPVAGAGLTAIRDMVAYLKRDHRYAIGFGSSQSAMVLRAFLYEGFNQDENGRKVFDGVFAHIAGARRSTFHRFTQPSRTAGPLRNASLSTTDQFPFADVTLRDPITDLNDGVLARASAANAVPKIIYTNSAYEYWGSGASLLHTTPDGAKDVQLPPSTRLYVFSGGQHGPAAFPPDSGRGQQLANFNDYRWPMRALLGRLHAWIARNEPPPASIYPTLAAKTLVPLRAYRFPAIPAVSKPTVIHTPDALDFGPKYRAEGVVEREPPNILRPYSTLVPQADANGNDVGGLRMPEIDCAIGTFTGWNLRNSKAGFEQNLLANTGSYIPFPRTAAERADSQDPRKPISERYAHVDAYTACVDAKSEALVAARLLLPEDSKPIRERAIRHWEWRMQQPALTTSTQRDSAATGSR